MTLRKLSNELQKIAEEELGEEPNRISEDLDNIRKWLQKQAHLTCRTDDQWLIAFLRGCKYRLEITKQKLDTFYTIRSLCPEFYANRDPFLPEIQEILKAGIHLPLPLTINNSGPRICFHSYAKANVETMTILNIIKVFLMISDILLLEDDNCTVSGVFAWADLNGVSPSYLLQVTPSLMKKSMKFVQDGCPARIKGIHSTNAPSFIEMAHNIMIMFATEKLRKRISLNSADNMNNFYKILPQEYTPKEFGGKNGSIADLTEYWKNKVESYREWFLEDEKYGTDEKLRPSEAITSTLPFGVKGSFRTLNID